MTRLVKEPLVTEEDIWFYRMVDTETDERLMRKIYDDCYKADRTPAQSAKSRRLDRMADKLIAKWS